MKLRIHRNSIRLRLSRSEVKRLAAVGYIEEEIRWTPTRHIGYRVETAEVETMHSTFDDGQICVRIPRERAEEWTAGNVVGLYSEQDVAGSERLKIAVEKDFACIDGPPEENVDTFPNPKADCNT